MIAAALTSAFVVVYVVPYVFIKHLGWGVLRRGEANQRAVGLTFDDGPDPSYTPRVLDVLARLGVQATFFVNGDAVNAHPELVRRILAEGHEVASHGYRHHHALFQRWPLTGAVDVHKGVRELETLIGRPTRYFRPPYGAYSWAVYLAILRLGLRAVNWSVEAHDWHPRFAPADVVRKVLREAQPGAIIVMHDGGRGGPRTVVALEAVLGGLGDLALRPVPLSSLAGAT